MSTSSIDLQGICKNYRHGKHSTLVLKDIHYRFQSGCFSVIAGPSGSGKSSLLNILGCLDTPDAGEYRLNGSLIDFKDTALTARLRKNTFGFIFQSFNLIPVLTALENVSLPLSLQRISAQDSKQQAQLMLEQVGLADKAHHQPNQLSGGEQQRVAIARAMATQPRFIFADEPTANLDRKNAQKIIRLMRDLNEDKGITFVFASHDDLLINAAKEVIRIDEGTLQAQETRLAELHEQPKLHDLALI